MILCDEKGRSIILYSKGNIKTLCIVTNADKGTIESETIDLFIEGLSKIINHNKAFRYRYINTNIVFVTYKNLKIVIDNNYEVYLGSIDSHNFKGSIEVISSNEFNIQFKRFLKFYNNG